MLLALFKCQMCGKQFEIPVLDQNDPNERYRRGDSVRCPECNSREVEVLRKRLEK